MIIVLFYLAVFAALAVAAFAVAERVAWARPLPRVTQRQLPPPLPGAYAEDVRTRIPSRRSRRAVPALYEDLQATSLPCEGRCLARTTLHEDHGDGSATCTRCGTPRSTAFDDGA